MVFRSGFVAIVWSSIAIGTIRPGYLFGAADFDLDPPTFFLACWYFWGSFVVIADFYFGILILMEVIFTRADIVCFPEVTAVSLADSGFATGYPSSCFVSVGGAMT